jgi:hypothetical protein
MGTLSMSIPNVSLQSTNAAYGGLKPHEERLQTLKTYAGNSSYLLEQIGQMTSAQLEIGAYQAKMLTEIKDLLSKNRPDTFTRNQ